MLYFIYNDTWQILKFICYDSDYLSNDFLYLDILNLIWYAQYTLAVLRTV